MTQLEAKEIIRQEKLKRYNWFNVQLQRENEVGITVDGDQWAVYVTDERASVVTGSITKFNNESDALGSFIKRLITEKLLF